MLLGLSRLGVSLLPSLKLNLFFRKMGQECPWFENAMSFQHGNGQVGARQVPSCI